MNEVSFWKAMFAPRPIDWKRSLLKRLQSGKNVFESQQDRNNKIKALEELLQ